MSRQQPAVDGRTWVLLLGAAVLAGAVGVPLYNASDGTPASTIAIQFLLLAGPGLLLAVGAVRLPRWNVHPELYRRVAGWTYGGPALFGALTFLYDLQPTGGIEHASVAVPVLLAIGCAAGFAAGVHDARARSRERELDERNRELDRRNRELRSTRAELEETVEQLQASNERLEQFAYAVSHDLQEPLRNVSNYLQLIESRADEELPPETREHLQFALDGAERMRAMIEGLLAYSRVETEAQPLEPVDLESVLSDVLADLHHLIEATDASVDVGELPTVRGDARQLRQVFQNLLDNAIEYSGDEPPVVRVEAERLDSQPGQGERPEHRAGDRAEHRAAERADEAEGGGPAVGAPRDCSWWRIDVHDEGEGIPPDEADRIFEVFERLHGPEEHEGTGVGLAICRRVVERHGGQLWVDSEPGEGSTFSLTLPGADAGDGAPSGGVNRAATGDAGGSDSAASV